MNSSWKLARRMLIWRQERRSLSWSAMLSIGGVAAGTAVLVLSMSILNGFEQQVYGSLRQFENDLILLPVSKRADAGKTAADLAEIGIPAQQYAERKLVIKSDRGYRLVMARIVPDLSQVVERFAGKIQDEMVYQPTGHGILIGALLADKLGLFAGDQVKLLSPLDISLADPTPPQLEARVQAVFQFGVLDFDDAYLYLDFEAALRLIPNLRQMVGLTIETVGGSDNNALVAELEQLADWQLRTWETDHTDLITAMKMEKLGSAAVLLLIILVATFNATSTMVMTIMEKYREIGILRSLGAGKRYIKRLFMIQGLIVGVAGASMGVALGGIIGLGQVRYRFIPGPGGLYADGGLPIALQWTDFALVTVAAILLCMLAAWYPARQAANIDPGQAVNYQK